MSDFNAAVIGCGRMGRERARCVHDLGGTVAAVYDVDLNRARSLAAEYNSRIVENPEEARAIAVRGQADVKRLLTPEASGKRMAERLEVIRKQHV